MYVMRRQIKARIKEFALKGDDISTEKCNNSKACLHYTLETCRQVSKL